MLHAINICTKSVHHVRNGWWQEYAGKNGKSWNTMEQDGTINLEIES